MRRMSWLAPVAALTLVACGGGEAGAETEMAAANPCAANPCAANPCAANPCAGMDLPVDAIRQGDRELNDHGMSWDELAARGAELWNDKSLSGTGATSCSTCHSGDGTAMMNASFAEPYPHPVAMAKDRAGLETVTAAEMVQLCMAIPMAAEPLDYGSVELAALTAQVHSLQSGFDASKTGAMNPCAANPCAANPCAANPCAANPCAASGMNPCASNPCGAGR
jgi:hypothetical protein